ncbi:MAG: hypothetical protein C0391_03515 [Anaerolinea sp.]|nr:hypothetical protein [Anaerolinea sp.]
MTRRVRKIRLFTGFKSKTISSEVAICNREIDPFALNVNLLPALEFTATMVAGKWVWNDHKNG